VKRVLGKLIGAVARVETVLMVAMTAAMISIIAAQVFLRYVFNKPFPWAEEVATMLLIYLSFIAADVVYKQKGHISVSYFVGRLPAVWRHLIAIVIYLFITAFLAVFLPKSIELVRMQFGHITSAAINIPKSWWTMPVPIAFASMLLSSVYYVLEEIELAVQAGRGRTGAGPSGP